MRVKPAIPGLLVSNPEALPPMPRFLPQEGAEVPDTEYWRRRLRDGDVILQEARSPRDQIQDEPEPATSRRGKEA